MKTIHSAIIVTLFITSLPLQAWAGSECDEATTDAAELVVLTQISGSSYAISRTKIHQLEVKLTCRDNLTPVERKAIYLEILRHTQAMKAEERNELLKGNLGVIPNLIESLGTELNIKKFH